MKQDRNEEEVLPTIDILRQDSARFSETIRIQQRFSTLWLQHSDRSMMPTDTKLSQEHEAAMVDLIILLAGKFRERRVWPDHKGIEVTQTMLEVLKLDISA